ncbi:MULTISPECIES: hypothetical protein [Bacteroidales]|jgi:hypothetical protein|uniref:hypothetical protein n=2 Tax=Bacteroidia TaxID=200643 RepID=UPI0010A59F72|nr:MULTISPECIES: hypothetical protein [Bacteroidales]QCD40266.1 hypothetical protein E7745_12445 [Duncaniella sp. C9]QCP71078.1 hypothetical protein FDZ78_00065 [Duncaniella sp. B8]QCP71368.1 hypothetical protein FDZ78_01690 [Duncaniella sp. B8]
MLKLCAKIEIKGDKTWVFEKITACEIVRDSEALTITCKLILPRKVKWKGETSNPIKRGDKISVWLGYDDNLQLAFTGYVLRKGFKAPIEIFCEDEMFMLKQTPCVKKSYKNVDIHTLLKEQGLPYDIKVLGEQNIGQYRVNFENVAELLAHLKENNIRTFFRLEDGKPVLYCGVLFDHGNEMRQVFATGVNIISDSSLDEQRAEDVKIKLRVVSLQPDNKKKIKVEIGDPDGEKRTLHCYGKTEAEAKAWGEQELERLKRDGLTGSFQTFGHVLLDVLDVIGIKIDGERKGKYQVHKNTITYGSSGFRQDITLGARAAE